MWRVVASIVAGLVAWVVVVTILNFGLRAAVPGYHAAETTLQFTLAMKVGRLIEAALTSLAAGAVIGWIDPSRRWTPWVVGAIVLAAFLPVHVKLWNSFPAWYHVSFLVPLVPLVVIGAALVRGSGSRQPITAS